MAFLLARLVPGRGAAYSPALAAAFALVAYALCALNTVGPPYRYGPASWSIKCAA